jgi:ectoine hydroxylase-related dioxygenase (phytanoyl-CoA dioxygenase family)
MQGSGGGESGGGGGSGGGGVGGATVATRGCGAATGAARGGSVTEWQATKASAIIHLMATDLTLRCGVLTSSDAATHVAKIAEVGYTIVENAIEPALVDRIAAELVRLEEALGVQPAQNPFEGANTLRIYNLLARGKVFEEIPVHASILPIVEGVLDRGCLVSSLSSITILPGESPQPVHADDQLFPLPKPHVPIVCNTMWAITDFTEENGATRVVPGTHTADRSPNFGEEHPSIAAVMPRGSVLVYHGSLWHGGGPNTSSARRVGVAMNYCAGWIRQQENQQLGIPLETARAFSPRLRQLVGYGLYRGLVGHIDKCSPVDLLDESGPRTVVGVAFGET